MTITRHDPADMLSRDPVQMFRNAIRLAWVAGELDDPAVHELTQLALARNALTPADLRLAGRNLVNLLAPAAGCRPYHQVASA